MPLCAYPGLGTAKFLLMSGLAAAITKRKHLQAQGEKGPFMDYGKSLLALVNFPLRVDLSAAKSQGKTVGWWDKCAVVTFSFP